jgi:hypothetical protein
MAAFYFTDDQFYLVTGYWLMLEVALICAKMTFKETNSTLHQNKMYFQQRGSG